MTETTLAKSAARTAPLRRMAPVGRDFMIGLGLFAIILLTTAQLPSHGAQSGNQMFSSSAHAAPLLTLATHAPTDLQKASVYRSTDRSEATTILGFAFASLVAFNLGVLRHLRRVYASPR